MTTHATLDAVTLQVAPGAEATCRLTVRNTGDLVEAYQLDVVGDAAAWAAVEPPSVSLYPGAEATAEVVFRPPRSSQVPAGPVPFAVRVVPSARPEDAAAPEGTVEVQPFLDVTAEIIPRTSKGSYRARHEVAIDNRGNVPVAAVVTATDPDGLLRIRPRPPAPVVQPGQATFVTVEVRNRKALWRGEPVTHPFQVAVAADDEPPIVLDAATLQTALVPRLAPRLAAALAALALLLLAGWFLLVKPAATRAAEEAVKAPLAQAQEQASAAEKKADQAGQKASTADDKANRLITGEARKSPPPTSGPPPFTTSPARLRLQSTATPGGAADTARFEVPERTTLVITDIVVQNPQGDVGRVEVLVGDDPILTLALAHFRDHDYHFVSPVLVPAGRTLGLRTTCRTAGAELTGTAAERCQALLLVTGSNRVATDSS